MTPPASAVCARCARAGVKFATTWPEGRVCARCYQRATRIHGTCPGCNTTRLLPGLLDGQAACTDCTGIPKDFHCTRCGREDEPVRTGLCAHCCLADDLTLLMAGTDGVVNPALQPLFDALTTQRHARSARIWLIVNPETTRLIRGLATGELALEHETFTEHESPRRVAFLRELCIEHGLLPPVNLEIERFQAWTAAKIAPIHAEDGRLIRQYVRWVHLNRMHHLTETGGMRKGTILSAKQSTTVAIEFLTHLRDNDISPNDCAQTDIDTWLATGPTTRSLARGFVRWAIAHGHIPPVDFPYRIAKTFPILTQQQRLDHVRALVDPAAPLRSFERAAALLMLVYGQLLTRVARMQISQVALSENGVCLSITGDVLTVPEPFAQILRDHLADLPNSNTSAHRTNNWLFPGGRPGSHINQNTLMTLLRDAGIDLRHAKNASLRALVLELPAPVVADSLGYSYQVTDQHRQSAGARFTDYLANRPQ